MTDPLAVSPDAVRNASKDLAALSAQMKTVLSTLQGLLSNEGEPWGDDDTGDGFANGPNGYLAQKDWVNNSIDAKTKLLDQYVTQLNDTADSLQQQDDG